MDSGAICLSDLPLLANSLRYVGLMGGTKNKYLLCVISGLKIIS